MNEARFYWLRLTCRFIPLMGQFRWWRRWCMGKWGRCSRLILNATGGADQVHSKKWIPLPCQSWTCEENW